MNDCKCSMVLQNKPWLIVLYLVASLIATVLLAASTAPDKNDGADVVYVCKLGGCKYYPKHWNHIIYIKRGFNWSLSKIKRERHAAKLVTGLRRISTVLVWTYRKLITIPKSNVQTIGKNCQEVWAHCSVQLWNWCCSLHNSARLACH